MPKIDEKKFLLILIFLHLAIALPLAFRLNIWVDEASTLYTTEHGFFRAFENLFTDEKQAPLYFLLLSLWRKINDSVFFARFFSTLFSLLAIVAFAGLARRIWEARAARFITALFALHPYLFWASLEIRLYSFIIFITCLLFRFFYDGYLDDEIVSRKGAKAQRNARIYYVLTAVAALYTNYYLGFLLVGAFAALLVVRRFRAARSYFMQMLAVGLLTLPLFYIVSLQFSDRVIRFQAEKSLVSGIRILWNHFLTFVLPTEIYTAEEGTIFSFVRLWIVRFSLLAVFVVLLKNKFEDLDKNALVFGTISAVCGAFLLFVYFQLGADYVEIRHAAIYFTAIFIFVSAVLVKILPHKAWILAAVLYAAFFAYGTAVLYPDLTKRGDWARVAEYISGREKPGQPIVVFAAYDAIALPYYYRGVNKILPDEKFFAFHTEAESGSPNNFRSQIEYVIGRIPPEAEEIWLLTDENCGIGRACEPLEKFVAANYTITEEKDFYKEKVRLLRKKQR
jgi:uncharacterized membrane protein